MAKKAGGCQQSNAFLLLGSFQPQDNRMLKISRMAKSCFHHRFLILLDATYLAPNCSAPEGPTIDKGAAFCPRHRWQDSISLFFPPLHHGAEGGFWTQPCLLLRANTTSPCPRGVFYSA